MQRNLVLVIFAVQILSTLAYHFWFTAIGGGRHEIRIFTNYLKVALQSSFQHLRDVIPVIIFSGNPSNVPKWLIQMHNNCSIIIVNHNISYGGIIDEFYSKAAAANKTFISWPKAIWIRLDIPNIMVDIGNGAGSQHCVQRKNDIVDALKNDIVIYTDVDIMFINDIAWDKVMPSEKYIGIGPEHTKRKMENSGVIFMRTSSLRALYQDLHAYANMTGWMLNDQDLQVNFYNLRNASFLLSDGYNWKPYWGVNKEAFILHFHGAKPTWHAECYAKSTSVKEATECGVPQFLHGLINHPHSHQPFEGYKYYVAMFYDYLRSFENRTSIIKV